MNTVENNFTSYPTPSEVYLFSYTKEDVKRLYRRNIITAIKRFSVPLIIFLFLACAEIIAPFAREIYGFLYGIITFTVVIFIATLARIIKSRNISAERIPRATYEYRVFRDYFEVFITKDGEPVRSQKIYFHETDKISSADGFISIMAGGQIFLLKENELLPQSAFFMFMLNNPAKAEQIRQTDFNTIFSALLFIATLLAPFGGALITLLQMNAAESFSNTIMWGFLAMLPIPVISVIFGFILKKKKYRYKKNIVAGCIVAVLLLLYGSFVFIPAPELNEEELKLSLVENIVGVDFPEPLTVRVFDYSDSPQSASRGYIFYQINASFYTDDADYFERGLYYDDRWLTFVPKELDAINKGFGGQNFHNTLILNLETGEYNTLPEESGTYRFLALGYWQDINQLRVVEYEVKFEK